MNNDDQKSSLKTSRPVPNKNEGSKSVAGGFFIVLTTLIGFFVGAFNGQVSIGAIGGFAIGVAIAVIIWLNDKKKQQE